MKFDPEFEDRFKAEGVKFEPLSELDHPFEQILANADELIKAGAEVHFKFTCENCRARQTFDVPNALYEEGKCEECGHVTNLRKRGGNYMVVASFGKKG
jgi:hypothetical protein